MIAAAGNELLGSLARVADAGEVRAPRAAELTDASEVSGLRGRADLVVEPSSADGVAAVVAWCYRHEVPVTPRGAGTGYAGGAVPDGGVVLSLVRLTRVRAFEPQLWRAEVEAGVVTATLARRAREEGLYYPVDPGAQESCTIGGNLATNAGGPHSFKYGVTRAWVTGVEAVLAPGELVCLGGPARKDVAGYDLVSLLVGSEGTLGVITAAWLRLVPAPAAAFPVAVLTPGPREGQAAVEAALVSGATPAALEFLDEGALRAAPAPFLDSSDGFLVIAEADGTSEDEARSARADLLDALGEAGSVYAPESLAEVRGLWRWRDGVGSAVSAARGGKLSEDIAVPLDRLCEAVEATDAIGARYGLDTVSWGHAGDGNVHATFLLDPSEAAERERARDAARELFACAIELGGTISGEHGLGLLKNGELRNQWSPAAVTAHDAIKRALDPKGLLNPGKKLP